MSLLKSNSRPNLSPMLVCKDCDPDDTANKGCMPGLICGEDNCARFHKIDKSTGFSKGTSTGMTSSTDCCEGKLYKNSRLDCTDKGLGLIFLHLRCWVYVCIRFVSVFCFYIAQTCQTSVAHTRRVRLLRVLRRCEPA